MGPPRSVHPLQPGGRVIHSLAFGLLGLVAMGAAAALVASCGQAPPISIPTPGDDGATDTSPGEIGSTDDAGR